MNWVNNPAYRGQQVNSDDPIFVTLQKFQDAKNATNIYDWLNSDKNDPGNKLFTDDEIISQIQSEPVEESDSKKEENDQCYKSNGEAFDCF